MRCTLILQKKTVPTPGVMKTGKPVINENQLIVERSGKAYVINTSTFPIEDNGRRIGTFDLSSSLTPKSKNDEKEDRNKLTC